MSTEGLIKVTWFSVCVWIRIHPGIAYMVVMSIAILIATLEGIAGRRAIGQCIICNRRCTLPSLDSHGRSYMGCGYCPRRTAGEIRSLQGCPERLFDQKN